MKLDCYNFYTDSCFPFLSIIFCSSATKTPSSLLLTLNSTVSYIMGLWLWSLAIHREQLTLRSILQLSCRLELLLTLRLIDWIWLWRILTIHEVSHFILKLWRDWLRHRWSWSSNLGFADMLLVHINDRIRFDNRILYWWALSNRQWLLNSLSTPHPISFNFFIWNEPCCVLFVVNLFTIPDVVGWQYLACLNVCSYGTNGPPSTLDVVLSRSIVAISIVYVFI